MMQQLSRNKWRFTAAMVQDAPDTRGVFALWENDSLICIGRADGGEQTIRACLTQHLIGALGQQSKQATHYSWEICRDPAAREAQLLAGAAPQGAPQADAGLILDFSRQRSA